MEIDTVMSHRIINVARSHLDRPFDYETFSCVHFVREVYQSVGIDFSGLTAYGFPPADFHLSNDEINLIPLGHCVFLKRKASLSKRMWTHVAIVFSENEFIHCTRHFGRRVVITPKQQFFEVYSLAPKPL